jgi:hypothetical protein
VEESIAEREGGQERRNSLRERDEFFYRSGPCKKEIKLKQRRNSSCEDQVNKKMEKLERITDKKQE